MNDYVLMMTVMCVTAWQWICTKARLFWVRVSLLGLLVILLTVTGQGQAQVQALTLDWDRNLDDSISVNVESYTVYGCTDPSCFVVGNQTNLALSFALLKVSIATVPQPPLAAGTGVTPRVAWLIPLGFKGLIGVTANGVAAVNPPIPPATIGETVLLESPLSELVFVNAKPSIRPTNPRAKR